MTTEAFAPAKINLTLHVTGQRDDGYHLLDSLVVFADVGDTLTFDPADALSLYIAGPYADGIADGATNLVWRAAEAAGWRGHITLTKNLPHGAGIGGGSADAAAVLRTLGGQHVDPATLGADVPVCILSHAARMTGIGDHVTAVSSAVLFFAVLVNPGVHVATPDVFKGLATKSNAPMTMLPPPGAGDTDWIDWLRVQRNDLQDPAMAHAPQISDVLSALEGTHGVQLARMSGSGATCFGLYPTLDMAQKAATALAQDHPDWWCVSTVLS